MNFCSLELGTVPSEGGLVARVGTKLSVRRCGLRQRSVKLTHLYSQRSAQGSVALLRGSKGGMQRDFSARYLKRIWLRLREFGCV